MFGKRLKELRQQHKMTQNELAKILNVSPAAVSHYENETREPSEHIIVTVAKNFSVSCDYLLGLDDVPQKTDYSNKLQELNKRIDAIEKSYDSIIKHINKKNNEEE